VGASGALPIGSDEFDRHLVSAEFVADPYADLRRMQSEAPIYWSDSIGGWLITRYDDIMSTFKNTTEYSNEGRLGRAAAHFRRRTGNGCGCSRNITRQRDCSTPTRRTTRAFAGLPVRHSRPAG